MKQSNATQINLKTKIIINSHNTKNILHCLVFQKFSSKWLCSPSQLHSESGCVQRVTEVITKNSNSKKNLIKNAPCTLRRYIIKKKLTVVQDGCSQKVESFSKNFPLNGPAFPHWFHYEMSVRVFRVEKSQNPKFGKSEPALCTTNQNVS